MKDVHKTISEFLLAQTTLTAKVDNRIWVGSEPPSSYKPTGATDRKAYKPRDDGPAIVFKVRGGGLDYEDAVLSPSVQFKIYGRTAINADVVYRVLCDVLHGGHDDEILNGELEMLGQLLYEPDTDWPYIMTAFRVMIRNS